LLIGLPQEGQKANDCSNCLEQLGQIIILSISGLTGRLASIIKFSGISFKKDSSLFLKKFKEDETLTYKARY
jgi:hypothetical protein